MRSIFVSPHSDDETLFGAYTIMIHHPLVLVIKSKDLNKTRMAESKMAMDILGANVEFIELEELANYTDYDLVFLPVAEGHKFHIEVSRRASDILSDMAKVYYSTYRNRHDLLPRGIAKVEATDAMKETKIKALGCYKSQIEATPCHFLVDNKDEYYA